MIDWRLAERLADVVAGTPAAGAGDTVGLADTVAQSERLVARYTRLHPAAPIPVPELVDRRAWVSANLRGVRGVLEPVAERVGEGLGPVRPAARAAAGLLLSAEVGVLFGLLSRRVLGQFELELLEPERPTRLLFVAPNLAEVARSFQADPDELVRWVALHEVTHALQFGGVPWLRAHLAGLVSTLLDGLTLRVDAARALRLPRPDDLRGLIAAVREGGLLTAVVGADQRGLLDRVQAVMAVIEGHAEHVMDAAGAPVLPSLPRLRAALGRRRATQPPLARLLGRLLGLDLKLRQYELGKRFCDRVVAAQGIERLNTVWTDESALPTLVELDQPERWLARTALPVLP